MKLIALLITFCVEKEQKKHQNKEQRQEKGAEKQVFQTKDFYAKNVNDIIHNLTRN